MKNNWEKKKLGDALNFRRGHDLPKSEMKSGPYPVIGSNGIIGWHDKYTTESPCLVIGRSGNVGNPFLYPQQCWAHNTTLYIDDYKGNDPKFLYFLLKTLNLSSFGAGSAVPTLNRNHIHPLEIHIPVLEEQKRIAGVLGALDDKIEVNNKMNKTLEEMARAIFKSWFVDFDIVKAKQAGLPKKEVMQKYNITEEVYKLFPNTFTDSPLGPIPTGWEVKSLSDIADFLNGYAFKSSELQDAPIGYPVVKMGNILKGGGLDLSDFKSYFAGETNATMNKCLAQKWDLLMCMTDMKSSMNLLGYSGMIYESNKYLVNQRVGIVRAKNKDTTCSAYIYNFINSEEGISDLRSRANSGVQVNLSSAGIKETQIIIPDPLLNKEFCKTAEAIYNKIFSNEKENKKLAETRDYLLPRLLSAQVRVK